MESDSEDDSLIYKRYLIDPKKPVPRQTTDSQNAKLVHQESEVGTTDSASSEPSSSTDHDRSTCEIKKPKRKRRKLIKKKQISSTKRNSSESDQDKTEKNTEKNNSDDEICFSHTDCDDVGDIVEKVYSSESDNDVDVASDEASEVEYTDRDDDDLEIYNESHLDDEEQVNSYESQEASSNDGEEQNHLYDGSRVTEEQSKLLTLAFSLRHTLPDIGLENLITLLDCHLSEDVLKSKHLVTKSVSIPDMTEHYFCENCSEILNFDNRENSICQYCKTSYNKAKMKKEGTYFVTTSLKKQIEELIHSDLYEQLRKSCEESDVINGNVYKKMKQGNLIGPNDITLQLNVDGVSLSKSSKASLWPILITINELPFRLRKNNVMICGLWFGEKKPPINMYLKPLVEELIMLCEEGIRKQLPGDEYFMIKVHAILCTVDSVARAMVQNWKQFNGSYGCPYCMHKGERIHVGRGFSRVYTYAQIKDRTTAEYKRHVERAFSTGKVVKGVKGPSILSLIPNFNVMLSCPPDYMHCCLLGVVKLFVRAWFNSLYKDRPFYLGLNLKKFNEKLLLLQPPSEVTRTPRPVTDNYKANEWKNFLLYFSLPCLKGLMDDVYFKHWSLLVFALNLLLQEKISKNDLNLAQRAINAFVEKIETLYGQEFLRFNVHLLLHLCKFVKLYGGLWAWSTFPFEGFNGVIRRLYFGTQYIPLQINKLYCRLRYLRNNSFIFNGEDVNPKILNTFLKLMNQCRVSNCIEYGNDLRSFGKSIAIELSVTEKNVVEMNIGHEIDDSCLGYDRFIYKHMLFHSVNYGRLRKRNNSVVLTDKGQIMKISRLLIVTSRTTNRNYNILIGFKYKIINEILCTSQEHGVDSGRYSVIAEETKRIVCAAVESIMSKCVDVSHPDNKRRCIFPLVNKLETD